MGPDDGWASRTRAALSFSLLGLPAAASVLAAPPAKTCIITLSIPQATSHFSASTALHLLRIGHNQTPPNVTYSSPQAAHREHAGYLKNRTAYANTSSDVERVGTEPGCSTQTAVNPMGKADPRRRTAGSNQSAFSFLYTSCLSSGRNFPSATASTPLAVALTSHFLAKKVPAGGLAHRVSSLQPGRTSATRCDANLPCVADAPACRFIPPINEGSPGGSRACLTHPV
ncbi:hypothetical protein MRX96_044514 [Rhipicephalus microplus]